MANDLETYTGILKYHNIQFSFVFDKQELRLIPPSDKVRDVEQWFMIHLGSGMYTLGNTVYIEDDFLVGKTNETGQTIIFLPSQRQVGRYNSVLFVSINAYIIKKYNRHQIDRMTFTSAELDCIYPVAQALCWSEWSDDGVVYLTTKNFDDTTTEEQEFFVNDKMVKVQFTITRTTSSKIGQPPLSLYSTILLEFDATDDYSFLYRRWRIIKSFIQYLCYRKNINMPQIRLSAPHSEGKHEYFADFFVIENTEETEPEELEKGHYIKQQYISGLEGKILDGIAEDRIYLRHLPQTYCAGRSIDAARFVMITAAFEWEFKKTYPDGVRKKESTLVVEKAASEAIETLFENSSGKLRDKYRYLKKRVKMTRSNLKLSRS